MNDFTTISGIEKFMADLRAAYEDLIGGVSQTARQRIRDAVATYSTDLLPMIDQRLLQCDALLRQGLRDEAIGRGAEEPALVAAADHMNLERFGQAYRDWMEASRVAGILTPVPPRMEFVRNLREAEQATETLQPLLTRWRRMNVAREPLQRRIEHLRRLRTADGVNPAWPELLKSHEDHRLMQIKASVARLRELRDVGDAAISEAERELNTCIEDLRAPWMTMTPPPALEKSAVATLAVLRDRRIDKQLDDVVAQLNKAYAALEATRTDANKDRLKAVWRDWRNVLVEKAVLSADDPRLANAKLADEYVDRLITYETRLAEVAQLLGERPSSFRGRVKWTESLDRMMGEIDDAASRLPQSDIDARRIAALSARVTDAVDDCRAELRFRRMRLLAAGATVVIFISCGVYTLIALSRHDRLVEEAVAEVEMLREKAMIGDQSPIPDFEARYPAGLRDDPRLASAIEALSAEERKQKARREEFTAVVSNAEKLIAAARGADRPDALAPWPLPFTEASQAIDSLRTKALALTDAEKARFERLEKSLAEVATSFSRAAGDAVVARVKKLEAELIGADLLLTENPDRAASVFDAADTEINSLRRLSDTPACPNAPPPYADRRLIPPTGKVQIGTESVVAIQLNALRARREAMAGLSAREARADAFLAEKAYGAYADILREIAKSLGNDSVARDYIRVADDAVYWQAISEWNDFAAKLGSLPVMTDEKAKKAFDEMGALRDEVKALPFARETLGGQDKKGWLVTFLEQRRDMTLDRITATRLTLEKIFKSQYGTQVDGVVYEKTSMESPQLFYCLRKDRPLGNEKTDMAFVTAWPNATGVWDTKSRKFNPEREVVQDSPQKLLASQCLKCVEKTEKAGSDAPLWFALTLQTCAAGAHPAAKNGAPSLDPLLHGILLRYVLLETVKIPVIQSDADMKMFLEPAIRMVEAGKDPTGQDVQIKGVENLLFEQALNPEKQHSGLLIQDGRRDCAEFIRRVAEGAERVVKIMRENDDRTARREVPRFEAVGRLRRQRDGGWWISGGDAMRFGRRELFVLHRVGGKVSLGTIGLCDDQGRIPPGTKVSARAGDPVYLKLSDIKAEAKGP